MRLYWLDINGANTGLDGIRFIAGNALVIENTNIDGFNGDGIEMNFANSSVVRFFMKNVSIRNCVDSGLKLLSTPGVLVGSMLDVQIANCGNGINLVNNTRLTARNCTIAANTSNGVTHTGVNSESTFFHCSITNNPTGINAANGISRISDNLIYGNVTGISGNVKSWGNNYIDGNSTNGTPVAPNLPLL